MFNKIKLIAGVISLILIIFSCTSSDAGTGRQNIQKKNIKTGYMVVSGGDSNSSVKYINPADITKANAVIMVNCLSLSNQVLQ